MIQRKGMFYVFDDGKTSYISDYVYTINLSIDKLQIQADGINSATIHGKILDREGNSPTRAFRIDVHVGTDILQKTTDIDGSFTIEITSTSVGAFTIIADHIALGASNEITIEAV